MKRPVVNYAKTLREADTLVLGDGQPVLVERITNAQGRRPPNGGKNLHIHSNGEKIRLNSEQVVRVIRS